ncbi:hypothetical protein OKW43_000018 [Paraburkholderia sp. WC7.3g]
MNRTYNRRTFMDQAHAYTQARQPTPQLIAGLCTAFAQMLADDLDGPVSVGLLGFAVVRKPSPQVGRAAMRA